MPHTVAAVCMQLGGAAPTLGTVMNLAAMGPPRARGDDDDDGPYLIQAVVAITPRRMPNEMDSFHGLVRGVHSPSQDLQCTRRGGVRLFGGVSPWRCPLVRPLVQRKRPELPRLPSCDDARVWVSSCLVGWCARVCWL